MHTVVAIHWSLHRSSAENHGSGVVSERTAGQDNSPWFAPTAWHCPLASGIPSPQVPHCYRWQVHNPHLFQDRNAGAQSVLHKLLPGRAQCNHIRWAPRNWRSQSSPTGGTQCLCLLRWRFNTGSCLCLCKPMDWLHDSRETHMLNPPVTKRHNP